MKYDTPEERQKFLVMVRMFNIVNLIIYPSVIIFNACLIFVTIIPFLAFLILYLPYNYINTGKIFSSSNFENKLALLVLPRKLYNDFIKSLWSKAKSFENYNNDLYKLGQANTRKEAERISKNALQTTEFCDLLVFRGVKDLITNSEYRKNVPREIYLSRFTI